MQTPMRALVLEDYGQLSLVEVPRPEPGSGEVLLRILETGICGSDIHGFTGENGRRFPGQIMGHETVARVAGYASQAPSDAPAVGALVTINPTLSCGTCNGCVRGDSHLCAQRHVIGVDPAIHSAFADYMLAPISNVVPLPRNLPTSHGALVEPLSVGFHAAARGGITAATRVLVFGAGPIGQAVTLGARRLGAEGVVVCEPNEARRRLITELGAQAVHPEELESLPGSGDFDVAIDAVGAEVTLEAALRHTRRGGAVVLVGMNQPRLALNAYAISTEERSIFGAFCYSDAEFRSTAEWSIDHPNELAALISTVATPEEAPEAFARLASGRSGESKVLVRFGPSE